MRFVGVEASMRNSDVRVFVVDDEQVIASTVATILRREGYTTEGFTNPWEALESATLAAPDLLISDVMMPELSGMDLAIEIQALYPQCKVLLFSGQAMYVGEQRESSKDWNSDFDILAKPIHPKELIRIVGEHAFSDEKMLANAR
jgi:DNA-binding NtrC family response regulator